MRTTMVVEAPGLGLGHEDSLTVGAGLLQGPGQDLGGVLSHSVTQDSLAALKLPWRRAKQSDEMPRLPQYLSQDYQILHFISFFQY